MGRPASGKKLNDAVRVQAHGQHYPNRNQDIAHVHMRMTGSARAEEPRTCHKRLVAPAASSTCHSKAIHDPVPNILGAYREGAHERHTLAGQLPSFVSMEQWRMRLQLQQPPRSHSSLVLGPLHMPQRSCPDGSRAATMVESWFSVQGSHSARLDFGRFTGPRLQCRCKSGRQCAGSRSWHTVQHNSRPQWCFVAIMCPPR